VLDSEIAVQPLGRAFSQPIDNRPLPRTHRLMPRMGSARAAKIGRAKLVEAAASIVPVSARAGRSLASGWLHREVGTYKGNFARPILAHCNPAELAPSRPRLCLYSIRRSLPTRECAHAGIITWGAGRLSRSAFRLGL
jgi:hypothetical protein